MINDKDKEKNEMDYLNNYLDSDEKDSLQSDIGDIKKEITNMNKQNDNAELGYLNVDISSLPLGIFYKPGTLIKIRAASVSEVQAYSVVDDRNIMDVTEKMNQLLSGCIKVLFPNGSMGSYKDIKDGDRMFLIFMIRELTFQQGNSIAKEVTCKYCTHDFKIPFRATSSQTIDGTFEKHEMSEKLGKYYNQNIRAFEFDVEDAKYRLAPPTIGIQEIFFDNIKGKVQREQNPNVSFMKIIPYMLWDRSSISDDGIKEKEQEFKRMNMKTFQILNQAVNLMEFGLKGLKMKCPSCGEEVHTEMTFPDGASSLFVIPDFFENFDSE